MREAAHAMRDRRGGFRVSRIAVSCRYQHAGLRKRCDYVRGGHLRRQSQKGSPRPQAAQQRYQTGFEQAQMFRVVHTAARPIEEWPLDVNSEYAGEAGIERALYSRDRLPNRVQIVADEGRHEPGGAEAAMRRADRLYRFEAGIFIEQHTAAAVHLHIDESRQQQLPLKIHHHGVTAARISKIRQRFDARSRNQHDRAAHQPCGGENTAVHQRAAHYTVSVILRRCGGWSGSRPRRAASASIIRYALCTKRIGASSGMASIVGSMIAPWARAPASNTGTPRCVSSEARDCTPASEASACASNSAGNARPSSV